MGKSKARPFRCILLSQVHKQGGNEQVRLRQGSGEEGRVVSHTTNCQECCVVERLWKRVGEVSHEVITMSCRGGRCSSDF